MQKMAAENQRNTEAESSWVRRHMWGDDGSAASEGGDDMGHTILGDITQPPAVVIASQPASVWPIAALALATMLPVAGVGAAGAGALAAYLLTRDDSVQPVPEYEDSSLSVGLGRLEDFEQSDDTTY